MKTILTTLAIGGLLCCASARAADGCCPTAPAKDSKVTLKPASIAAGSTVTLKVTGMTCDKCAAGVQKALKKVDGVKAAEVSLDKEQAVVTVDAAKAKTEQLIAAVDKAGGDRHTFKAEEATEPAKKSPQIFCEGKSAGQLCGGGTVGALKLDGDKKAAWSGAVKRYNTPVEAATQQLLKEAKETLSPEEFASVEKWFAKGVNSQINQQLVKEGK